MAENRSFEANSEVGEQGSEKKRPGRQVAYGIAFVGGMGAATVCNMTGYPGLAFGFGMVGLVGLATFIGSLRADD